MTVLVSVRVGHMASTWLSSVTVAWTPILTYARRRQALLDWMESNTDLLAFRDDDDVVGFAFGAPDQRLTVSRNYMVLSSGASGQDMVASLDGPTRGVLEVLEPSGMHLHVIAQMASAALDDADYDAATRRFANAVTWNVASALPWRADDASVLVDLHSDRFQAQVEFGVVRRDELHQRIAHPGLGRVANGGLEAPDRGFVTEAMAAAPELSLFLESRTEPIGASPVKTLDEVWEYHQTACDEVLSLTQGLASSINAQEEA